MMGARGKRMVGRTRTARWWDSAQARRYVGSYGTDQMADGLVYLVLAWVAVHQAGLGVVWVAGAAAAVKFAALILVGGALGDRYGASRVVGTTLVLRVLLIIALVLAIGSDSFAALVGCALIFGAVDGAHEPSIQALSTEVVPPEVGQKGVQAAVDLARKLALLAAGPVAGFMILAWSPQAVLVLAIVFLVGSRLLLPGVSTSSAEAEAEAVSGVGASMAALLRGSLDGVREVRRLPDVLKKLAIFLLANMALTPPVVVGVPLLTKLNDWSARDFGIVDAGYAGGALIGGLASTRWGDELDRAEEWAVASLLPTALAIGGLGWAEHWAGAAALTTVAGVSTGFGPPLLSAAIKEATPARFQSRVQSMKVAAIVAAGPLGLAVFSFLVGVSSIAIATSLLAGALGLSAAVFLASRAKQLLLA